MEFEELRGGISVEDALSAFRAGCNRPYETLWITESWWAPFESELRKLLSDPVTDEEAEPLRGVVLKIDRLETVIQWLTESPRRSFARFKLERAAGQRRSSSG